MPHSQGHMHDGAASARNEPTSMRGMSIADKLRYMNAKINQDAPEFYGRTMGRLTEKYGTPVERTPYRGPVGMPDAAADQKRDYDEGRAEAQMIKDEMNDERYNRE